MPTCASAHAHTLPAQSAGETVPQGASRTRRVLAVQLAPGDVVAGRYRIARFVAQGAFGAVYQADDLEVAGHTVALKLMHRPPASREERERCLREVRLIAAVEHPSVVSFKDHGWHRGRFYIVMPWYDGETLAERIRRDGPLDRQEAERLFERLAEALDAMHARGVRHQDIKPDNILLARFGDGQRQVPLLLDLGVGAQGDEWVPAFTPAYVAPEMARAHVALCARETPPAVDGRADVFALALTLRHALSPLPPERTGEEGSLAWLAERARSGLHLPSVPELRDLRVHFARWLHVDPDQRPTARQLARELRVLTHRGRRRQERARATLRWGPVVASALALCLVTWGLYKGEQGRSRTKDAQLLAQASEMHQTREQLAALEQSRTQAIRQRERLRAERNALSRKLETQAGQLRQLQTQLQAQRGAAHALEHAVQQSDEREQTVRLQLQEAGLRVQALESELDVAADMERELSQTRDALDRRSQRLEDAEVELALERAEREVLLRRLESLEAERSALQAELERARTTSFTDALAQQP